MLLQKLQIQFHNVLPIFLSIPAKNLIKIRCLEQKKAIMTPRFPPMPHAMPIGFAIMPKDGKGVSFHEIMCVDPI